MDYGHKKIISGTIVDVENLLRENISPDTIFKIGSPLYEVYQSYSKEINDSEILKKLSLEKEKYFLISVHREENLDDKNNFDKFLNLLSYLEKRNKEKIIVSTHPRTIKRLKKVEIKRFNKIIFAKPFSYTDYCSLQLNSKIVFSNKSSNSRFPSPISFLSISCDSPSMVATGLRTWCDCSRAISVRILFFWRISSICFLFSVIS